MATLSLIAVVGRNRVIGRDNQLIWRLPEDMAHFKATTAGFSVLMGRKTWESLPPRFRPLPGRRNLVLTRQPDYDAAGAERVASLPAALAMTAAESKVFVIGGAELYAQALPLADELILTEVDDAPVGDAYFPAFDRSAWREAARDCHIAENGLPYAFVTYHRNH